MGITHKWNGTILTITSDSGTSSADLKGEKGDMGIRGAQGVSNVARLTPLFANSIEECEDTTKLYVLPDGYIYAFTIGASAYPLITYETKNGGYYHSGKVWYNGDNLAAIITNDIPVSAGDKFIYKGVSEYDVVGAFWYDKNKAIIKEEKYGNKRESPVEVIAPANAAYVCFQSYWYADNLVNLVLDIQWVLCQAASGYQWINTGRTFVSTDYEDRIIALEEDVANLEATTNYEDRVKALETEVANIQVADYGGKISNIENSLADLQQEAVEVFKPLDFKWASTTSYVCGSVGNKIISRDITDSGYGYAFIQVKESEVYNIIGAHAWESCCWALTDENGIILSMSENTSGGFTEIEAEITIPVGVTYLYFNKCAFKSLTKKTAISTAIGDVLYGKTIVYDGDSIAESRISSSSLGNGGAYAKIIAERTYGKYVNKAVGGAYLRSSSALGVTQHSVVDTLASLPKDADLYCFEGGINDYWNNATLGTYSKTDFTGAVDTKTVCGALETIFRYALDNFKGKPICFVITHKIQGTAYGTNGAGNTFEDYRNAMVGICNKYSIPYYDAFNESGLNGWNSTQNNLYLTSNTSGTADGCHPNEEGYKRYYVPQLMALFRKIMPN